MHFNFSSCKTNAYLLYKFQTTQKLKSERSPPHDPSPTPLRRGCPLFLSASLFWTLPPWPWVCNSQSLPCLPNSESTLLLFPHLFLLRDEASVVYHLSPGPELGLRLTVTYNVFPPNLSVAGPRQCFEVIECSNQKHGLLIQPSHSTLYGRQPRLREGNCGSVSGFTEPGREATLPDTLSRSHFTHLI